MQEAAGRLFRPAVEDQAVQLGGLGVVFKLFSEDTGGRFSIVEHPIAPGTLAPAHVHAHEDEFSIVLEGEIGIKLGDRELLARPGDYVLKLRGIPHAFWNAGPPPARMIEIISPGGFERYFEEVARILVEDEGGRRERIAALRERYGLTFVDWNEDLIQRYGLNPGGSASR